MTSSKTQERCFMLAGSRSFKMFYQEKQLKILQNSIVLDFWLFCQLLSDSSVCLIFFCEDVCLIKRP